ncbi:hypothetical protein G7046_g4781 [Stylonectria norvegica]|nr:hypothetical protein G7046_g4781 [Stylonectria norvegica]
MNVEQSIGDGVSCVVATNDGGGGGIMAAEADDPKCRASSGSQKSYYMHEAGFAYAYYCCTADSDDHEKRSRGEGGADIVVDVLKLKPDPNKMVNQGEGPWWWWVQAAKVPGGCGKPMPDAVERDEQRYKVFAAQRGGNEVPKYHPPSTSPSRLRRLGGSALAGYVGSSPCLSSFSWAVTVTQHQCGKSRTGQSGCNSGVSGQACNPCPSPLSARDAAPVAPSSAPSPATPSSECQPDWACALCLVPCNTLRLVGARSSLQEPSGSFQQVWQQDSPARLLLLQNTRTLEHTRQGCGLRPDQEAGRDRFVAEPGTYWPERIREFMLAVAGWVAFVYMRSFTIATARVCVFATGYVEPHDARDPS